MEAKFRERARLHSVAVHQTPPRSSDHNAIVERVQGTLLQEFYRTTFHRGVVADVPLLNQQLQQHLQRHNTQRRNHGDWMRGRIPAPGSNPDVSGSGWLRVVAVGFLLG